MQQSAHKLILLLVVAVGLAGCAITPEPVTEAEKNERSEQLRALFEEQEQVDGTLTVAEVMARAVKYNIDHRVRLMEHVLAKTDLDASRWDLLPRIVAEAGYTHRSNENASSSQSVTTGLETLEPSRSTERDNFTADLGLVWNVLDFGVSYVTSQQKADQVLIAEERRRKAVQNIIRDVRLTYWEALNAQRLGPDIDQLLTDIEAAVAKSQQLREQGLQSAGDAARFQESLLTAMRQLWRIRDGLESSRLELARLMNAQPGTEFKLDPAPEELTLPDITELNSSVEEQALVSRPELREEDYQLRIDQLEVKKAMLRMFPGLEINLSVNHDNNDFLVNNEWSEGVVRFTWNLFNVFAGPAFKREAEANVALDDMRRLAISMAVLTQLHVAYENYRSARTNYDVATQLAGVNKQIFDQFQARQQARRSSDLDQIRTRARAILAQLQRDQAFAQMHNAVGQIQASIGLDPVPQEVAGHDIETLSRAIAAHQQELGRALAKPSEPQQVETEEPAPRDLSAELPPTAELAY